MIVNVEEKDLKEIILLEKKLFNNPWSESMLTEELSRKNGVFIAFVKHEKICGYAILSRVLDQCELLKIAVDNECQKQGIATKILSFAINSAGAKEFFLEVRQSNNKAINLYKKCGFKTIGERKNYYKNPTENAVLMGKGLDEYDK